MGDFVPFRKIRSGSLVATAINDRHVLLLPRLPIVQLDYLKETDPEALKKYLKEKGEESDSEDESLRRSIREFRKDFSALLDESKIKKLVVVIDDLDRCLPDTIIETLEAIKLFLFVRNTAFILGADERLVKYAVRKRFPELPGERVEVGRDYLEKLVQFPVRVPPLGRVEMETYISLLFVEQSELDEQQRKRARERVMNYSEDSPSSVSFNLRIAKELFADNLPGPLTEQLDLAQRIAPLLSAGLKGNPRQCKRFLNTLLMRMEMAQFRKADLQQRLLAKLMLLEYFKPESFRRLAELQEEQEGKPLQLVMMEREANKQDGNQVDEASGGVRDEHEDAGKSPAQPKRGKVARKDLPTQPVISEVRLDSEFKTWLNQNWVSEWLRLDPPLAEIDLRPYFYFSRDALINPLIGETQRMSPVAQEIFAELMKDSQAARNSGVKKAADLSVADAAAVFESLSQRAQQEEEYGQDNRAFFRLFDWAEVRKELRGELVTLLRRLPEGKLSAVVVPKILSLCAEHESEDAAHELIRKWSNGSNRLLTEAAKGRLKQQ